MSIVVLQLPKVKRKTETRPRHCPHCQREILQRWGQVEKRVKDTKVRNATVYRYYCTSCKRTFRHYPMGVGRAQQTERLKKVAVIGWSLGLSYRGIAMLFAMFGVSLSRMSGWRDVQAEGAGIKKEVAWKSVRVAGIDGAWVNGAGVMVAVDLGDGEPFAIAHLDEKDMAGVLRWLRVLKQRHGIGAIVTDDLAMYRSLTEKLELGHQVCQFHVRRWVSRTLRQLERELSAEWLGWLEKIKVIMETLPPDGGKQLLDLYRHLPRQERSAVGRLRHLLIRLSENWERYTAFFHDPGLPWTNNRTEQVIGRMKLRAKTVRGYKTEEGLLNGLRVSSAKLL